MITHKFVLTLALALPTTALAQLLTGVTVDPSEIQAGGAARITVNFDVEGPINCGLRVHFGDGTTGDYKINQTKDVPLVVTYTYSKAGDYRIMAEPKTVGTLLKCGGRNQLAMVKVAAVPAVVAPTPTVASPKPAAAAGSRCPEGWKLDRKSVNKKTGAFTCRAAPGTMTPGKLACPGDLTYFENEKKGVLGCRP